MCRSRRSPTLLGHEIADRALGCDASAGTRSLGDPTWSGQPFGDETVQGTRPIEWNEKRYRLAVVGHGYFVSISNGVEVTTQAIT